MKAGISSITGAKLHMYPNYYFGQNSILSTIQAYKYFELHGSQGPQTDIKQVEEVMVAINLRQSAFKEMLLHCKNGKAFTSLGCFTPIRDHYGNVIKYFICFVDIDDGDQYSQADERQIVRRQEQVGPPALIRFVILLNVLELLGMLQIFPQAGSYTIKFISPHVHAEAVQA